MRSWKNLFNEKRVEFTNNFFYIDTFYVANYIIYFLLRYIFSLCFQLKLPCYNMYG
jgi:hypothetical protein